MIVSPLVSQRKQVAPTNVIVNMIVLSFIVIISRFYYRLVSYICDVRSVVLSIFI